MESYGGDYARVGLSVVWSHDDVMVKTVIEGVSTPPTLIPGFYEFKVIVEGLKGEEVVRLSKTVVTTLKKHELLVVLTS